MGDSITAIWMRSGLSDWQKYFAPLGSYDIAIRGEVTQITLWRMEHGALDELSPKLVVLMIGSNDLALSHPFSPEDTAHGVLAVVDQIRRRLPDSELLLLGILPRGFGSADSALRRNIRQTNAILAKTSWQHVHYLDIGDVVLNADGSVSSLCLFDGIHPTSTGFMKMAPPIYAAAKQILEAKAVPK